MADDVPRTPSAPLPRIVITQPEAKDTEHRPIVGAIDSSAGVLVQFRPPPRRDGERGGVDPLADPTRPTYRTGTRIDPYTGEPIHRPKKRR